MKTAILFFLPLALAAADWNTSSGNGKVSRSGDRWVLSNAAIAKTIAFEKGTLGTVSLRNNLSRREVARSGAEFRLGVDGEEVTGQTPGWQLVKDGSRRLAQGEVELTLTLRRGPVEIVKHYVLYPNAPLIREWAEIANVSSAAFTLTEPGFLESRVLDGEADALRLHYVTGGGNYNGSQLLKTEPMTTAYTRVIDSEKGIQKSSYSGFLPLLVIENAGLRDGVMAGWDYMGHWVLKAGNFDDRPGALRIAVAGYRKSLDPGARITTPKAFLGVFSGGLDEMGNSLLDWQYEYMWDRTTPEYFAKARWAVDWPSPWAPKGGKPSADNWGRRLALDLRYVDMMRQTGCDILWDDAGWYDSWGSWNGPDWRQTTDFLAKHTMKWVLWWPTFLATADSEVAQKHPDWRIPGRQHFEQSLRATADWQADLLEKGVRSWNDFQWRYDIAPAVSATDTGYLDSDQNFRYLLEKFKATHPRSGVDACYGGGRWISYDLARLCESGEYTDGGVGPYSAYYTSLLVPPDKLHNVVDFDHTRYNAGSDRIHLSMNPTWYRDPGDGPDLEALRKDWELYRYMVSQGVAGRWSHVWRPKVTNDDAVWYFQRSNRDGSRAVIIAKHPKQGDSYFLVAQRVSKDRGDHDAFFGQQWNMSELAATDAAMLDTGIYQDPTDAEYRYYGVPGEAYGPLNLKYRDASGEKSLVTGIVKLGARVNAGEKFFGAALQMGKRPLTVTELGIHDPGTNRGVYRLSIVRPDDRKTLATAEIDMLKGGGDALGFRYAPLAQPLTLEPSPKPVVIFPRGLNPDLTYDLRCAKSSLQARRTGRELMDRGIELAAIEPGELIFLNLQNHPGSGTDRIAPGAPARVTKRIGTNLGIQGVEIAWHPASDNNWVSYYEVLRDGVAVTKVAIGTYFFDYGRSAAGLMGSRYAVRTVDGDGNRSAVVEAGQTAGDAESYRALGGFSREQGAGPWRFEEAFEEGQYRELRWDRGGYEGLWLGSDSAAIGRIWMQAGQTSDVARTFVAPANALLTIRGEIRKDPSAGGRGASAHIMVNGRQVWPASGWAEVPSSYHQKIAHNIEKLPVNAGDKVRFVLRRTGVAFPDPVVWDPIIVVQRTN